MRCPKCGSSNVDSQTFQENRGTTSMSKARTRLARKKHGVVWWILIGWWWWIIDLCLWYFMFTPRLIIQMFKRRRYIAASTTVNSSENHIVYVNVCTCQNCGHVWRIQ